MPSPEHIPPVVIDPSQAYEAPFHRLISPEDPGYMDQNKVRENLPLIESGAYPEAAELLAEEENFFGLSAKTDTDEFLDTRRSFYIGVEKELQDELEPVKTEMVDKIATYFAKGDEATKQALSDRLWQRTTDTKNVIVRDNLSNGLDHGNTSAFFSGPNRQIFLSTWGIIDIMSKLPEVAKDYMRNLNTAHEVIHSLFVTGERGSQNVKNGLETTHYKSYELFSVAEKQGVWLNEAVLEDFRQELTETPWITYEPIVAVLRFMEKLDPGIKEALRVEAFDGHNKGQLIGRVENILGPLGIEEIGKAFSDMEKLADTPQFIERVASLLPKDKQADSKDFLLEEVRRLVKDNGFDRYVAANLQEGRIINGVDRMGWFDQDVNQRFERLSNLTTEDFVAELAQIHNLVAPDVDQTPTDFPMKAYDSKGEKRREFAKPEERYALMNDCVKTIKDLIDQDDGTEEARQTILQRASNVMALTLGQVHAFEDGNGRTLRTLAYLYRFGIGKAEQTKDLVTVAANRPTEGFRMDSFVPITSAPQEAIKAAASLDIPLKDKAAYAARCKEAFLLPYDY